LHGRIAAYAWGEDYHDVLPGRLRELVKYIEAQVGHPVPNRWYTDTGPILERELAQRAGLGWIGKNTCLINPEQGSYFLLAEILLGIELEPDPPFIPDRCGGCRRCLQACPTGCILPDRTLDARRCISYLTIELKGSIPGDLRPLIDGWVFGCDVCQIVCPWNRFAAPEGDPAFNHTLTRPYPDLLEELAMDADDFSLKYRRSPLRRAKRRGYLRNLAVALGNTPDPDAIPALRHALMLDEEPLVRAHAAWALGKMQDPSALQALKKAAESEADPLVRLEIQAALKSR
jgi:epoxyqueuosine reductase